MSLFIYKFSLQLLINRSLLSLILLIAHSSAANSTEYIAVNTTASHLAFHVINGLYVREDEVKMTCWTPVEVKWSWIASNGECFYPIERALVIWMEYSGTVGSLPMQHWGMTGEVQALDMLQQYLTNLMMKWLSSDRRFADGALWSIEDMILFKGEEDVFYQVEFPLFEFQFRMAGQGLQDGRRVERIRWTWSFEIVSRRINRFVSGVSVSSLPSCRPRSPGTELLVFPLSLHFLAKSLVAPTLFFLLWFA